MNTGCRWEPCVLLVNGTFIWPVTFSCSRIVYYRRNLFVGETPAEPSWPHIMLIYCVISCLRYCFPWPYDFLFASQYTHYILTFSPLCTFFSLSVCVCGYVQTSVAGCSYLASSFIMLSRASRSLMWAEWNKHTN